MPALLPESNPSDNNYIKYPRTFHLPWSPGVSSDDKVLDSTAHFVGRDVVVTTKMDGENTTLYRDHIHARSIDSEHHPSQTWVRHLHGRIKNDIPVGWRICGENLFAKHSIPYTDLESFLLVFSIFDERNVCLNYDDTIQYCEILGLGLVPMVYFGKWDELTIKAVGAKLVEAGQEGYVVRLRDEFPYSEFGRSVAKYVRPNHVTTSDHWKHQSIVKNGLRNA
jgi:hypothetical protein